MIKLKIKDHAGGCGDHSEELDFEPQKVLQEDIWDGEALRFEVKEALLAIVEEFKEFLGLEEIIVEDIQLTGSLANYNYTSYSDIDLHLLIDFDKVDENDDLVKEYFKSKKNLWNNRHNIRIKGFEVEIYPQNVDEMHHSTGVYSILEDNWVKTPKKSHFDVCHSCINNKVDDFKRKIDEIPGSEDPLETISALKEKIWGMRKAGLEEKGEFSTENLAFKVLRRAGYLAKMDDFRRLEYDKSFSLLD